MPSGCLDNVIESWVMPGVLCMCCQCQGPSSWNQPPPHPPAQCHVLVMQLLGANHQEV